MIPLVLWWLCGLSFSAGGAERSRWAGENVRKRGEHPELHHFGVCEEHHQLKKRKHANCFTLLLNALQLPFIFSISSCFLPECFQREKHLIRRQEMIAFETKTATNGHRRCCSFANSAKVPSDLPPLPAKNMPRPEPTQCLGVRSYPCINKELKYCLPEL